MSGSEWISLANPQNGYEDRRKHAIISEMSDGKTLAMGRNYSVVGSGDQAVNVRIPDLAEIDVVISLKFQTSPATYANWIGNYKVSGNVVGVTVYQIQAGTTLSVEAIATGLR